MAAQPQDSSWFRKLQPGEVPPPPPPELVQWANNTLMATLVGTLYGGARAHVTREPPSPDVHPQARTARSACSCLATGLTTPAQVTLQRYLVRVARGTASTGFQARARAHARPAARFPA